MRQEVRADEAVDAEVGIVGLVAEVAAVGPVAPAVRCGLGQALIAPVPHESATEGGMIVERLDILGEGPVGIAHRM